MSRKPEIWVHAKTRFEGYHCWPGCPHPEVYYLRQLHRHMFYVEVRMTVTHNDRECEFIMIKHFIDKHVAALGTPFTSTNVTHRVLDTMSCEQIAESLYKALIKKYGEKRRYEITVSEDDENGATLIY